MDELWMEPDIVIRKRNHDPITGRYAKGARPWNKGLKGLKIGGVETQFKQGRLPHNTKRDNEVTLRRDKSGRYYQFVRIEKAKWIPLHRYIWQMVNGAIPKGCLIIFLNKDSMDCSIENLACIDRAQHAIRNHNREKAAKSIAETWRIDRLRYIHGMETRTKWFNK